MDTSPKLHKLKISVRRNPGGTCSYKVEGRTDSGKRTRRFFKTKAEAVDFRDIFQRERRKKGELTLALSSKETLDAQAALKLLSPLRASLVTAAEFYLKYCRPEAGVRTVAEVVDECLQAKERAGKKVRYLRELRCKFRRFCISFGEHAISTVRAKEVEDWVHAQNFSGMTVVNYLRELGVLFSFAKKRGYCAENVLCNIEMPRFIPTPTEILTVPEILLLLDHLVPPNQPSALLPCITLGLFAGLRASEIEGLDWRDIDFESDTITVRAEIAKTSQQRNVYLTPNLKLWLQPHKQRSGPIASKGWRRTLMGVVDRADLVRLPHNAFRHSFASYHLAFKGNAGVTATELGHSQPRMVHRHYKKLVTRSAARAYFTITPPPRAGGDNEWEAFFGDSTLLNWADGSEGGFATLQEEIKNEIRQLRKEIRSSKLRIAA